MLAMVNATGTGVSLSSVRFLLPVNPAKVAVVSVPKSSTPPELL